MNIKAGFFPPYVVIHWGPIVTTNFAVRKWSAGISFYGDWWRCSYFETILGWAHSAPGFYRSVGPFFIEREPTSDGN